MSAVDIGDDGAGKFSLAETIRRLRNELSSAMEAAEGERLQFTLGDVELELKVSVGRDTDGKVGATFWVLSLGASHKVSASDVHTVKLKLTPVDTRTKPLAEGELRVSGSVNTPSR